MCLPTNFIGIRGDCNNEAPVSGLYINDLAGISLARAASTTDDAFIRGRDFLRNAEDIAFEMVRADFMGKLSKDFSLKSIVDSVRVGIKFGKGAYLPIDNENKVAVINTNSCDALAKLRLNSVQLYAKEALVGFQLHVSISDETTTFTVNLKKGLNTINVNLNSADGQIIVSYTNNYVQFYEQQCGENFCKDYCDCSCDSHLTIDYYSENDGEVTQSKNRNGFGINAALICDTESVFCDYINEFRFAIWYKMGIYIAENYLSSDRSNPVAFAAKRDAEKMLARWKGGNDPDTGFEMKPEYWSAFGTAYAQVKNALQRTNTICFDCQELKVNYFIP
jgi:hypothetical protein